VLGLSATYEARAERTAYYWVAVASSIKHAFTLNHYVLEHGPGHLLETTRHFWHAWVTRRPFHFVGLSDGLVRLFHQSLFIIRAHADQNGGIIASGDSAALQRGKDTYAYLWPRDAAYAALALNASGDNQVAKNED